MDIIIAFEAIVPGSSPGGCTKANQNPIFLRKWDFDLERKRLCVWLLCKVQICFDYLY